MTFTTLRLKISKLFGALEDNGRTFYSFGIVTDGGKTARHADFRYFVILSIYVVCCADFNVFETTCTCYNTLTLKRHSCPFFTYFVSNNRAYNSSTGTSLACSGAGVHWIATATNSLEVYFRSIINACSHQQQSHFCHRITKIFQAIATLLIIWDYESQALQK